MIYYLGVATKQAMAIQNAIQYAGGTVPASSMRRVLMPEVNCRNCGPNDPDGPGGSGGSPYNCATDGAAIFYVGMAFATIGLMTGIGELAGAAWAGMAIWGGGGTTIWGMGHVIAGCHF